RSVGAYLTRLRSDVNVAPAQVAELVDALASGASDRKVVEVRVFSWAPFYKGPPRAGLCFARPSGNLEKPLYASSFLRRQDCGGREAGANIRIANGPKGMRQEPHIIQCL